mmetsp:Transcript_36601/g.93308  ORF Transcript_36601/g.93308 Transcript_36601/m.93308 type:complete len:119 (+) Transcript_36601:987-1343(+)
MQTPSFTSIGVNALHTSSPFPCALSDACTSAVMGVKARDDTDVGGDAATAEGPPAHAGATAAVVAADPPPLAAAVAAGAALISDSNRGAGVDVAWIASTAQEDSTMIGNTDDAGGNAT